MNKLMMLAGAAALSVCATAASAATFDFTELFANTNYGYYLASPGPTVTGSFTGTADGNLITDLSNISVYVNGVPFAGNGGNVMSFTLTDTGFQPGGVASFDGTQNNFYFVDNTQHDPYNNPNSLWNFGLGTAEVISVGAAVRGEELANWSVTQVSPVPVPAALPMFAAAAAGFAAWGRRRRKAKAAA